MRQIADARQMAIEESADSEEEDGDEQSPYREMINSMADTLETPLEWKRRFQQRRVLRLIRAGEEPVISWIGTRCGERYSDGDD